MVTCLTLSLKQVGAIVDYCDSLYMIARLNEYDVEDITVQDDSVIVNYWEYEATGNLLRLQSLVLEECAKGWYYEVSARQTDSELIIYSPDHEEYVLAFYRKSKSILPNKLKRQLDYLR